jgi:hypothetical protein
VTTTATPRTGPRSGRYWRRRSTSPRGSLACNAQSHETRVKAARLSAALVAYPARCGAIAHRSATPNQHGGVVELQRTRGTTTTQLKGNADNSQPHAPHRLPLVSDV